ncbi:trimeric intracellular cation channel family protein [Desulfosediminicola flagellatus]|uniref:trimeric intracellular cation channel family protein n=1 Tax=Desulfosediminicola flagellatus TaxID=2569541 RepID=UPI001C3D6D26|nr:trimeric intracellular cation channel family protein [Desulfosediminicola flagellatus]
MIYYLGMIGIAAFSITGVLAAGKKDMDIFSIVLLGFVTAIGGGTVRDIILDTSPVFWIADTSYLWVSVIAAVITFFCVRLISRLYTLLLYIDGFGLALFTILATENTIKLGFDSTIAVLMGLITGITGGMIRDILTARMPMLLRKEFYATPALIGAIAYVILNNILPEHEFNRIYAVGIILLLRIMAIHWGIYYPGWLTYSGENTK